MNVVTRGGALWLWMHAKRWRVRAFVILATPVLAVCCLLVASVDFCYRLRDTWWDVFGDAWDAKGWDD